MATSLDFSQKLDLRLLGAVVKEVIAAASEMPFLLAGAMARDLLLVHAHGIPNNRATVDVDLAFLVKDWKDFEAVRKKLLAGGEFKEVPREGIHKLRFRQSVEVDRRTIQLTASLCRSNVSATVRLEGKSSMDNALGGRRRKGRSANEGH